MNLSDTIIESIIHADAKALATYGNDINVVPVSTMKVIDNKIILVNYFMGKTLENIICNPRVALVCWKGLEGYRIVATAQHKTDGALFEDIQAWVSEILPDRIVRGILILKPESVYDISANSPTPGKKIN